MQTSEGSSQAYRDIQIFCTPSGDPSLKYRGIWLHSSRNPREEAKRFVQSAITINKEQNRFPIILLGFGLGYTAESIREQYPENPLIIIEPSPEILLRAFETRDLSSLLGSTGIIFIVDRDMDTILSVLPLFSAKPMFVIPRPYREAEPELAKALLDTLSLWETKNTVNKATVQKFGKRWVKNIVANQQYLTNTPGIRNFARVFSAVPALVVAAGPSLDEVLPYIPALYERCLIISVDTALRALLRTGIEPDFVVVVDPQYWNARHLDFCEAPKACIVTEIGVYPSVLRHYFEHRLLCSSLYPLGSYLEKDVDPKGRLGAGGSVSTTALDLALYLGAQPVYIAGLDLAYPDFKTHFTGALFEERAFVRSNRFLPAETQSYQSLMGAQPFYAPCASGGRVLTDTRLSLYTTWFESRLRQLPPGICKSLAPKGIHIPGLDLGTVENLLTLPVIRPLLQERISSLFKDLKEQFYAREYQEQLRMAWEKKQHTLVRDIKDLYTITQRGKKTVETLRSEMEQGFINMFDEKLAELDQLNEQIAQSSIKDIAGFLFSEKRGSESADALASYLDSLHSFYTGLLESLEYQLFLFKQ
uniref:DUF115 domain-containing protein n=1 Tax=Gracilinema caldarium TaxID=215591 RepID=A0A7C3EBX8_9SPIR